jgi:glucose/arabinose dehydrogenase
LKEAQMISETNLRPGTSNDHMRVRNLTPAKILAFSILCLVALLFLAETRAQYSNGAAQGPGEVIRGQSSYNDWTNAHPGNRYLITSADLPKPGATGSAVNSPDTVARPANAWPSVPNGFLVDLLASDFRNPRIIRTAPNGDLFVAESNPGRIHILRVSGSTGKVELNQVFATGLSQPYGIAFYPPGPNPTHVYIGNTDSVVRFPYQNGDAKASGPAQKIVPYLPNGGAHWTRDIVFSADGKKMFIAVGSASNVNDDSAEKDRANVLEFNPDGSGQRVYASGIRNPSGIAIHPASHQIWVATNERDALGDNLVPDYVTHIVDGGFYGWPWYYIGGNQDPRHAGKHPELKDKALVPDVLIQSHSAPLGLAFYTGSQFPAAYRGDIFVASHGSWNRGRRTGYKIIRIPAPNGSVNGEYQDFVTGFVRDDGDVWGRPVGVAMANDGSLVFTDDASNSVWRVSYVGDKRPATSK